MNGTHPLLKRFTALAALAFIAGAGGCQTHPTAMTNPFASPDRVPPPATRTLLPGQAAPYYQGDPLPAMQGAMPGNPNAASLANNAADSAAHVAAFATQSQPQAFSNETSVSIPSDDDPLRFPLPPPSVAAQAPAPSNPQPAAAPMRDSVSPAVYNQFVNTPSGANTPTFAGSGPIDNTPAAASQGPWRSPRIAPQYIAAPVSLGPPVSLAPLPADPRLASVPLLQYSANGPTQVLPTIAAPSMGVRLRPVASPGPQPVEADSPRIRLPGYPAPQPTSAQYGVEPAAYYSASANPATGMAAWPGGVLQTGGVIQTVQITPLAATAYAPGTSPVIASTSGDGFRPRGSMR